MSGVPDHIAELVESAYNGNHDFNSRAFRVALWFVGHDLDEDAYVDFVSTSGIGIGYKRNDLTKRLRSLPGCRGQIRPRAGGKPSSWFCRGDDRSTGGRRGKLHAAE